MNTIEELRDEVGRLLSSFPEDVGEMRLRLEKYLRERALPSNLVRAGFTVRNVMDSMTNLVYRDAPSILETITGEPCGGSPSAMMMVEEVLLRVLRDALVMATFVFEE